MLARPGSLDLHLAANSAKNLELIVSLRDETIQMKALLKLASTRKNALNVVEGLENLSTGVTRTPPSVDVALLVPDPSTLHVWLADYREEFSSPLAEESFPYGRLYVLDRLLGRWKTRWLLEFF
jgi:hypothetical protein